MRSVIAYRLAALATFAAGVYTFMPDIRAAGAVLIVISLYLATRSAPTEANREELVEDDHEGAAKLDQSEDEYTPDPRDEEYGDGREVGPVSRWITIPERQTAGARTFLNRGRGVPAAP